MSLNLKKTPHCLSRYILPQVVVPLLNTTCTDLCHKVTMNLAHTGLLPQSHNKTNICIFCIGQFTLDNHQILSTYII